MQVSNSLERIVPNTIERLIEDHPHIKECVKCSSDVLALTLTGLPPAYSSTEMGRILKNVHGDKAVMRAEIAVVAVAAIEKVKQNPRH